MKKIIIRGRDLARIPLWKELGKPDDNQEMELYQLEDGESFPVEKRVSPNFSEPKITKVDFDKWLADQRFYSEGDGIPIDKYILESYLEVVGQFIKSPNSKATKGVFEVATQTIKKYLS